MVIGILQLDLVIPDASSIKDKRRVVRSLRDRIHREHQASVAEIGGLDTLNHAVLGIAVAGADGRRIGSVLDAIAGKARRGLDAEVAISNRRIISVDSLDPSDDLAEDDAAELADELTQYAGDTGDAEERSP